MQKQISRKSLAKGMVDISTKEITLRTAFATAEIYLGKKVMHSLLTQNSPKGDVLETARVAGIMAAKQTAQLIPMCHPLDLNKVNIDFQFNKKADMITLLAEVKCRGRTGVEMEALCAAAVAALTIYDMMKWVSKEMVISQVKLLRKSGGKSGDFVRR
jgi:cyclic pyranopterin monophosphate synthase